MRLKIAIASSSPYFITPSTYVNTQQFEFMDGEAEGTIFNRQSYFFFTYILSIFLCNVIQQTSESGI